MKTTNPGSRRLYNYYTEILQTEGFNSFNSIDISALSAATLAGRDIVVLGETPLTAGQVAALEAWVDAGGNLIAMRPAVALYTLLGLSDDAGVLSNAYLKFNTSAAPAAGLVDQTIQFHGDADLVTIAGGGGATSLATLYANASTATGNPAITLRSVGSNGGQAAAFLYDLARSVVYTRQGNPAWSGQDRDGFPPVRSNDLFFGAMDGDPQPDWVDLAKVEIPQADEQQRLLANLMLLINSDRKPLPRFWYFPRGEKAVIVMTGDDHGNNGTTARFERYKALSPIGCSVADWECIRSSSYVYPNTPLNVADVTAFQQEGFELLVHTDVGCEAWATETGFEPFYGEQIAALRAAFPNLLPGVSHRTHCIAWGTYDLEPSTPTTTTGHRTGFRTRLACSRDRACRCALRRQTAR
jgi:hypothetical protein